MRENTHSFFAVRASSGQTSIVVAAGVAIALLLVASAWRIGDVVKMEEPAPLSYERPSTEEVLARKPIESNRNWQDELASL